MISDIFNKARRWFKIFFHVHPHLWKWSNLTNIFQVGWNHQLESDSFPNAAFVPVPASAPRLTISWRTDYPSRTWSSEGVDEIMRLFWVLVASLSLKNVSCLDVFRDCLYHNRVLIGWQFINIDMTFAIVINHHVRYCYVSQSSEASENHPEEVFRKHPISSTSGLLSSTQVALPRHC